jgi:hypothetical protein
VKLQSFIRIQLKTHIRLETAKTTIPLNVNLLILLIFYFYRKIENYCK